MRKKRTIKIGYKGTKVRNRKRNDYGRQYPYSQQTAVDESTNDDFVVALSPLQFMDLYVKSSGNPEYLPLTCIMIMRENDFPFDRAEFLILTPGPRGGAP